jgi:hypothetical protein
MHHFMVSVSFRSAPRPTDEEDQSRLAASMEAEGFSRRIGRSGGTEFRLPRGEYYLAGEYTRGEVLARVKRCAAAAGRKCAVLITQGEAFLWSGLEKYGTTAGG